MATKTVYSYDSITGEYKGETVAYESPRRLGTFLIPANATEIAPPETNKNEIAIFSVDKQEWAIMPDFRNEVYYDTETQGECVITEIGMVPDKAWTDIAPTDPAQMWNGKAWEITFDILKERKKEEIAAMRYAAATGYLKIGDHTYNVDKDSQTAMLGTLAAFQAGVLTITNWKTVEGFVVLSADEFMSVVGRVLAYIEECFGREKDLLTQIDACGTASELDAILW